VSGREGSIQEGGVGVEVPQATRAHGRWHPWFLSDFRVSFLLLRFVKNYEAREHHSLSG